MKKKIIHCKMCGHTQDGGENCENCGAFLGFYGEFIYVEAEEVAEPELTQKKPEPPKEEPEPPKKEQEPPKTESEASKAEKKKEPAEKAQRQNKKGKYGIVILLLFIAAAFVAFMFLKINVIDIQVTTQLTNMEQLEDGTYLVETGQEIDFHASAVYEGKIGKVPRVIVTSSDSDIVKVQNEYSDEKLIAMNPGTAEITAAAGNHVKTYSIEVYDSEVKIPDFLEFANGYAMLYDENDLELYSYGLKAYSFYGSADRASYIFQEYCTLLRSMPLFEERFYDNNLILTYTGRKELMSLEESTGNYSGHVNVILNEDTVLIFYAEEIIMSDTGDRTSITSKFRNFTLLVHDSLYDIYDTVPQQKWFPEGYTSGYSVDFNFVDENDTDVVYSVKSSDPSVLEIDEGNRCIHAVSPGKAIITVSAEGMTRTYTYDVYPVKDPERNSLKLNSYLLEVSNDDVEVSVDATLTWNYSDDWQLVRILYGIYNVEESWCDWEEYTMTCDITYEMEFVEPEQKVAMVVFAVQTDGDANYDLKEDILDYKIIEFKR